MYPMSITMVKISAAPETDFKSSLNFRSEGGGGGEFCGLDHSGSESFN